jgi:hypothetical protein
MYICPVCGYERLPEAPLNFSICACCGTEFEFDDFATTYAQLRARWVSTGYRWFSPCVTKPLNWDPIAQLNQTQFVGKPNSGWSQASFLKATDSPKTKPYAHAY